MPAADSSATGVVVTTAVSYRRAVSYSRMAPPVGPSSRAMAE